MWVQELRDKIKATKASRKECHGCPLFGSPIVTVDSNRQETGPIDVFFIGLNPGPEEKDADLPFVGKAGRELRSGMYSVLPEDDLWAISNCILCYTRNEAHIPEPGTVLRSCFPMLLGLIKHFPARVYVPLGAKAMSAFGIRGPVKKVSGRVLLGQAPFLNNGARLMPLIHPSAVNRPNNGPKSNREIFSEGMRSVARLLAKTTRP